MNIIPVIRDLLLRNQKAVIPGFGTFFIIRRPAQLNKTSGVLTPPATLVKFDKNQQINDGKLSEAISARFKQSVPESLESIEKLCKEAADEIGEKGYVEFAGLGKVSRDQTGDFEFSPDDDLQKRISLFELPTVNVPVKKPDIETPPPQVIKTETITPPVTKPPVTKPPVTKPPVPKPAEVKSPVVIVKRRRKWWIPVSVVFVLLLAVAALYFTGGYKNIQGLLSHNAKNIIPDNEDKLVFGKPNDEKNEEVDKDSSLEKISKEIDERTSRENALAYDQDTKDEKETTNKIPEETASAKSVSNDYPYHIIAGAFLVPNNAERQVEQLTKRGLTAAILPKKGDYYMVSLGSYPTSDEAAAAMKQIKEKAGSQVWVMKR